MGIRDRDYMKRASEDDGQGGSSDSRAEELAQQFLKKFPRFFIWLGIGVAILIVVGLIALKFSGANSK
jgi:hypothetical protein